MQRTPLKRISVRRLTLTSRIIPTSYSGYHRGIVFACESSHFLEPANCESVRRYSLDVELLVILRSRPCRRASWRPARAAEARLQPLRNNGRRTTSLD